MWNKKFILKILLSGFLVLVFSVNYFCDEVMAAALPTPSLNLLQTFGKGLRFGDPSVFLNNEENLIWGVLNGGSGTGSIIKIQNDSFSDIFRIGWNGNLITSGFVQGTQLCIGAECRSSWPDVGSASGWVKSGSNVALSTITDRVGIGISSPSAKLEVVGGGVKLDNRVSGSNSNTRRYINVASYYNSGSLVTGTMVITVPVTGNEFLHLKLSGYNYQPDETWEAIVGGYFRSSHNLTYNRTGVILGNPPFKEIRFARDSGSGKFYIFLGDKDTSWRYASVSIDVLQSLTITSELSIGWSVDIVGEGAEPATTHIGPVSTSIYGKDSYINNDLKVSGGIAAGGYDPSATHRITTPTFYAERAQIGGASGGLMTALGSLNAKQLCIEGNCKSSWGPNSSLRTKVNIAATPNGVDYVCPAGYVMVGIENSYPAKLICDRMW